MASDLWGFLILLFLMRGSKHVSKRFGERMAKLFEFYPGEHALPTGFSTPQGRLEACNPPSVDVLTRV